MTTLLRRISRGVTALTTPLLPDDYLTLVNPLWTGARAGELCGRITAVRRETAESASLLIKPGHGWAGHRAGQWVRVGVDIDGVRHYRTFSLSDAPGRPDGRIRITVKANPDGIVSRHLVHGSVQGSVVQLSQADGDFVLPESPERLLFVTAGSGVTPVVAMLRELTRQGGAMPDVVVLHCAPTPDEVILGGELRLLALRHPAIRLYERYTRSQGRLDLATDLEVLCPDWRDRLSWVCGPTGLLDAAASHWAAMPDRLRLERFRPLPLPTRGSGEGGEVCFRRSGVVADADGATPLLVVGEEAGALMPSGCRMGICFTCVGRLGSGRVRDLRTGAVHGEEGDLVQTCVSAAAGPVSIDL